MLTFSMKCTTLFSSRLYIELFNKKITRTLVRVRFAPSPTGLLHLGGLRTALYNYLFAKAKNGVAILRIEDTDQVRKVDSATENLIYDLQWCGITFDEGPYFQSERIEIYKKYAYQLIDEGKAYYCFCNKLRLELLRKEALKNREIPKYDNKCRLLSKEEIGMKFDSGEVPCIRFKLTPLNKPTEDLIHEPLNYKVDEQEGDPVILKADGFPTYHFANVIDDHLMNISHVLRGVEWQVSTAKHILLYNAFNWKPPVFGHIPLLLNPDGSKLSKRQNDIHIKGLREQGYFPNAVLNFIVRFGGGFNILQKEKDEKIFTMEELIQRFDLSKLGTYSSRITLNNLDTYNCMEIKRLLYEKNDAADMVKRVQEILKKYIEESGEKRTPNMSPEHIQLILKRMQVRINKLEDMTSEKFICLWFWDNITVIESQGDIEALEKFIGEITPAEWTGDSLKNLTKAFVAKNNLKYPKFMKLMRKVLIEAEEGPGVVEIMEILSKEIVIHRLRSAIEKSKNEIALK